MNSTEIINPDTILPSPNDNQVIKFIIYLFLCVTLTTAQYYYTNNYFITQGLVAIAPEGNLNY